MVLPSNRNSPYSLESKLSFIVKPKISLPIFPEDPVNYSRSPEIEKIRIRSKKNERRRLIEADPEITAKVDYRVVQVPADQTQAKPLRRGKESTKEGTNEILMKPNPESL
jgi:hypothetical protein